MNNDDANDQVAKRRKLLDGSIDLSNENEDEKAEELANADDGNSKEELV